MKIELGWLSVSLLKKKSQVRALLFSSFKFKLIFNSLKLVLNMKLFLIMYWYLNKPFYLKQYIYLCKKY